MKKLKLENLGLSSSALLNREQLKKIYGGSGSSGGSSGCSGGGGTVCSGSCTATYYMDNGHTITKSGSCTLSSGGPCNSYCKCSGALLNSNEQEHLVHATVTGCAPGFA